MKKIFTGLVLSVFTAFGLCACSGGGDVKCTPDLNKSFCVEAEIDYDGDISKAEFQRNGKGSWKRQFTGQSR